MAESSQLIQKLWNYRDVLHDDGMSYGDYVERLTYLPFLKMADDRARLPDNVAKTDASRALRLAHAVGVLR